MLQYLSMVENMKIEWLIEKEDIFKIKTFVNSKVNNEFVQNRIQKNVSLKSIPKVGINEFWECMIVCLMPTQQKVGPDSQVAKFTKTKPFPLNFYVCSQNSRTLAEYVENILKKFGGIRFIRNIGKEVMFNYDWLFDDNGWVFLSLRFLGTMRKLSGYNTSPMTFTRYLNHSSI